MKAVAKFFGDDIHEGDLILHNDPVFGGSHAIDTCICKRAFQGKLVYWTVCKGHLTDIRPAGYNPNAKEVYAECLRIPPVKIWDRGKPRTDVLNMILTNMRARRDQEGDFNARSAPARWASATFLPCWKNTAPPPSMPASTNCSTWPTATRPHRHSARWHL